MTDLLRIEGLRTEFPAARGPFAAVDGVDLTLEAGRTLGVVGESGCGKSMLSLSVMRLVPPPGRIAAGRVMFGGQDLVALPPGAMRHLRGRRIAMIFQEPMTSLNPAMTVGDQVMEAIRAHEPHAPATCAPGRPRRWTASASRPPIAAWTSIRTRCRAARANAS